MQVLTYTRMDSPVGALRLTSDGSGICRIAFSGESEERWNSWCLRHYRRRACAGTDPILEQACAQLGEYFEGRRRSFRIPLSLQGTEFQLQVWRNLGRIPYGTTRSYGEVGRQIGRPKGSRAVGRAVGTNPVSIVIPCHRVIGKNGALVGFGGGLDRKKRLLELEGFSPNGWR